MFQLRMAAIEQEKWYMTLFRGAGGTHFKVFQCLELMNSSIGEIDGYYKRATDNSGLILCKWLKTHKIGLEILELPEILRASDVVLDRQ